MTSRLRMNPPTTVWSSLWTKTGRARSSPLAASRPRRLFRRRTVGALSVGLAIGLLASAGSIPAEASDGFVNAAVYVPDAGTEASAVRTVSYSTGKSGHQLRWRPQGTSEANVRANRPEGQFAQFTSPIIGSPTDGGAVDPFDDPFGDAEEHPEPSQPRPPVTDEVLEGASPRLLVTGSVPQIPPGMAPDGLDESREPGMFLDDALVVAPELPKDPCAAAQLESISKITHDISPKGEMFPVECRLIEGALPQRQIQGWAPITFTWKASGLCHKPAYFEDVHLEVYGHSWGPYLQPVISGAHFFLTVPILPYKMGLYPPHECIYSLGYYRPGSCAPYMLDPLPISIRAGLAQAGVMTGMAFLIP